MAFRGQKGNMRLPCQPEVRTHMSQTRGAPSAPKSILTPLKRLSASMALQCNYPVGNDISTQFLPASLLPGSGQLPQARWKLCGPRWLYNSCYLIPAGLRDGEAVSHAGERAAVIWSEAVLSRSLSRIQCDVAHLAVKITGFSAATKGDILWKLQVLMISYDNLEAYGRRTYDRQSDSRR